MNDWKLPGKKINDLQQHSVAALVRRAKQAHFVNVRVRINGEWEEYEADWLKHMEMVAAADQPSDGSVLEPGEEWWMDVAGVPVALSEWEPGARKRRATDPTPQPDAAHSHKKHETDESVPYKAHASQPSALPCGHPASLLLRSAETGDALYCEACDDKSGRRDAEQREAELSGAADQPDARACTCHPDDNPPVPCPRKYALTECRAAAQPSEPLPGSEAYLFRELMAIIHRDGGHYLAQHGPQKSYDDAVRLYYERISTTDPTSAQPDVCVHGQHVADGCFECATAQPDAAPEPDYSDLIRLDRTLRGTADPTGGAT